MMFCNPFERKGNWYKGNLHTHTTNSDGVFSPEEICKLYKEQGYDFIAITDHHKITTVSEKPDDLLLIPSSEMSNKSHIVGLNLKEEFDETGMSDQKIINEIVEQNGLAIMAHPYWRGTPSNDLIALDKYIGIEIYNNVCHVSQGKGFSTVHFDDILQTGKQILGFASDDTHRENALFGGFIMVKAEELTLEGILEAIELGSFYSSTGVLINSCTLNDTTIHIKFDSALTADFIGHNGRGRRVSADNAEINEAEYQIKGTEKYLRIEITDKNNKKAWVNPLFL
ncbi:CehA/McbA family metallohydrolase [bacterium]|nr:CehA/McbA family metallohydrolase [bacterium]